MSLRVRMICLSTLFFFAAGPATRGAQLLGCTPQETSGDAETPSLFPCVVPEKTSTDAPAAPTDLAYNKDFWNSRFGFHALNNFPGFSVVDASVTDQVFATDFEPTATTLYALNSSPFQLGTYDLTTGAFSLIGTSTPSVAGHNLWSGMAVDPVSGVMYASAIASAVNVPYGLYTLNPTTGAATLVGQDATSTGMIALAMNCAGELFGHDVATDSIYRINPATGAVTLVGPTGFDSNFAQGMDFDNESGALYAWTYQGGGANRFGTIDTTTGALTTLSSSNPIGEYEGAIRNVCVEVIFNDGFESGDTSAWSLTVP